LEYAGFEAACAAEEKAGLKPDLEAGGLGGRELLLMPGGGGYAMMNTEEGGVVFAQKRTLSQVLLKVPLSRDFSAVFTVCCWKIE
jgi:hypothetical protein